MFSLKERARSPHRFPRTGIRSFRNRRSFRTPPPRSARTHQVLFPRHADVLLVDPLQPLDADPGQVRVRPAADDHGVRHGDLVGHGVGRTARLVPADDVDDRPEGGGDRVAFLLLLRDVPVVLVVAAVLVVGRDEFVLAVGFVVVAG